MTLLEFPNMGRRPSPPPGKPLLVEPEAAKEVSALDTDTGPEVESDYVYFGDALRAARTRLGMTQFQLASRAGVALGTVHIIEHGRQNPTFKILLTLANALNLKIGDLLPQTQSETKSQRRIEMLAKLEAEIEEVRSQLNVTQSHLDRLLSLAQLLRDE